MEGFECKEYNFVIYTFLNWQPVKIFEHRSNVIHLRSQGQDTCCIMKHTLKSHKLGIWQPKQCRIAMVKSGCYQCMHQFTTCLLSDIFPCAADVMKMEVCCPAYCQGYFGVKYDSNIY